MRRQLGQVADQNRVHAVVGEQSGGFSTHFTVFVYLERKLRAREQQLGGVLPYSLFFVDGRDLRVVGLESRQG